MTPTTEVLVLGSVNDLSLPKPFLQLSRMFARNVDAALRAAGLGGTFVDTAQPLPAGDDLRRSAARGLVLLGGGDIDPTLYGHHDEVPNLYGVHGEIDDAAMALIADTLDRDVPILALCRGAQLVNVALGGTLVPDLAEWGLHRGPTPESVFITEHVEVAADSMLAEISGASKLEVLNGHHQAIDVLGRGVRATAWAEDGVIEAIEVEDRWVVGVQWHPEHDEADADARAALFAAFGDAVRSPAPRPRPTSSNVRAMEVS